MPRFRHHTLTNGIAENSHYIFVCNILIIYLQYTVYLYTILFFHSETNMGVCGSSIGGGVLKIFWGNQWTSNEEEAKTKHILYVLVFSVYTMFNCLNFFPGSPCVDVDCACHKNNQCDRVGNTCSQHLMTRTWLHWANQSAWRVIALTSL